jgi:hypothetical protein
VYGGPISQKAVIVREDAVGGITMSSEIEKLYARLEKLEMKIQWAEEQKVDALEVKISKEEKEKVAALERRVKELEAKLKALESKATKK